MVCGVAVRSDDDEVVDLGAVELDRPVDQVHKAYRSFRGLQAGGHLESYRSRHTIALAARNFVAGQRKAGSIIPPPRSPLSGDASRGAFDLQFFWRAVTVVR